MSLITFACGVVCLFGFYFLFLLYIYIYIYFFFWLPGDCHKIGKVMCDAEVARSKTCLLLESEKQNTFAFKNNLESMRVS